MACVHDAHGVERRQAALARQNDELQQAATRLRAAEADLAAQAKQRPPRTQAEVSAYNQAVTVLNGHSRTLSERSRELLREQAAYNDVVVALNGRCGTLMLAAEDLAAVEQERRRLQTPSRSPSAPGPPATP
jgi:uncharacterized protein YhaN